MKIQNVRLYRPVMLFTLSVTVVCCATTELPPLEGSQSGFAMTEDETRTWKNAEELDNKISKAGLLYQNPSLEKYLDSVAQKLVPRPALPKDLKVKVKVIQDPFLNAMALPHGVVYIHTGMLARMENEAQLATVLGHELVHFTHRHLIKEMRSAENKSNILKGMQIALTLGAGQLGSMLGQVGTIWALASIRGYSRELETEADVEGLKRLILAGYDPMEAPKVFEYLRQELDGAKVTEPFFFGTHPRLEERIDNYRTLLKSQYATQVTEPGRLRNAEEFYSHTAQLLLDNAILDIEIARLNTAQAAIEKHLQQQPFNSQAHFLLGEVHRRSGNSDIFVARALASYKEAARLDPLYAAPHRELGLLFRKQNQNKESRDEFEKYLSLSPTAIDRRIIMRYLTEPATP